MTSEEGDSGVWGYLDFGSSPGRCSWLLHVPPSHWDHLERGQMSDKGSITVWHVYSVPCPEFPDKAPI